MLRHEKQGPARLQSIPHIVFLPLQLVALQKEAQLLLKRDFPVMFLLSGNVVTDRIQIRDADGKDSVTGLPSEGGRVVGLFPQPDGGGAFEFLHKVRLRDGPREPDQEVDVILNAVDQHRWTIQTR